MIDKLGLSTINWKVDGKNRASDEFEEGTEQYYQNRLIRDFLTLLIDPNTTNILHRSIDHDTKLLTDIVDELEGKSTSIEEPYGFYSLATQTERKNDYITGKIGIGPFALNNNNHILTMLYDVHFKNIPGSIMSVLGLTNLATPEDFEHNSVMSWISALINAHVDIAKERQSLYLQPCKHAYTYRFWQKYILLHYTANHEGACTSLHECCKYVHG